MTPQRKRCAIYTRKSSEEGLEQSFNSLDAQREACVAYVQSQRHEGWKPSDTRYDDGGYSGGSMERPALQALMKDIAEGRVDVVVVYKVDRLTRSLADFAKIVEIFDAQGVSFVSVTQQFNTTTSMGRLTLNVLLSFAQFEREVTGERIRDKIAASKKKGMWMGGLVPLGYDLKERKLLRNEKEASLVKRIYERYLELGCVRKLQVELKTKKFLSKVRVSRSGTPRGGAAYSRGALYSILQNRLYLGEIEHKGTVHQGQHEALIERDTWDAVQARLKANNDARRSGIDAKAPTLLAGLVYDQAGHRLTPLHSTKGKMRYRYYASQAVIQNGPQNSPQPLRIPAHEIEQLVLARLKIFFQSERTLLDAVSAEDDAAAVQQALVRGAAKAASAMDCATPACRVVLLSIVTRITVSSDAVEIRLRQPGIRQLLTGKPSPQTAGQDKATEFVLDAPARFRRLSGAVRMIVPPSAVAPPTSVNDALLKAIARGRRWYEMLVSGEVASLHELARSTGLNERYVSRVLRCAFLAPDIVEAVIEGRQPQHLSLNALFRVVPIAWGEQRQRYLL